MQLHFQYLSSTKKLLPAIAVWPGEPEKVWCTVGALHIRKHTNNIQPWHPVKHHYDEASHCMKQVSKQWPLLPRNLPHPSQDLCSRHVLLSTTGIMFFWLFHPPPSPILYPGHKALEITPSDFSLTSTTPYLTILFISLIYSFLVLTLHLSLCPLLTQSSPTAIDNLRKLAPPKSLKAFTTSKSVTDNNTNHGLPLQNSSILFHCSSGICHFHTPFCLPICGCAYMDNFPCPPVIQTDDTVKCK